MIPVRVLGEQAEQKKWPGKDGKPDRVVTKFAVLAKFGVEQRRVMLELQPNQPLPAQGDYILTPEFTTNEYADLKLGRRWTLEPAPAKPKAN